jgi:glutamate transport system permease protein
MDVLIDNSDAFVKGFWLTFQLVLLAAAGALLVGTVVAILRISPVPPLRWIGTAYVNVFRNLPLTIVFFLTAAAFAELGAPGAEILRFPGLSSIFPRLGADLPFFRFAFLALTLYTAAFVCEALRSGINSVPQGQAEAARSLGMTFLQNLRFVVLPQATKAAVVPLGSVIIAMIKNSAIAGAFGVTGELFSNGVTLTSEGGNAIVPVFVGISLGYLVMTVPLGILLDRIEGRRVVTR